MYEMIERQLQRELTTLLSEYPVVTVLGPRQSGKTTLARHYLDHFNYRNLEVPDLRQYAIEDPRGFLEDAGEPLILDEIQRVPELLSYLQSMVDERTGNGRFVLTGSHQLLLREAISQSLAGRTAILNLLPLSISELAHAEIRFDHFSEYLWNGFLPRVYDQNQRPSNAYANYFHTYVERDVRHLVKLKDASLFEKFLRLLAGRTGQLVNLESLGNDAGVDAKTVKHWLSVLEASFIVVKLPPYFENVGKRLIKSPKYYFVEPGLLTYLLGINDITQINRDPLVGALFENLVVIEAWKSLTHRGDRPNLTFYRDNQGLEIDLLYNRGSHTTGIEMKSASTIQSSFTNALRKFDSSIFPLDDKVIFYGGKESRTSFKGVRVLPFKQVDEVIFH